LGLGGPLASPSADGGLEELEELARSRASSPTTCASSWLMRASRVAITASLATISARSRAMVAAGSSSTPPLAVLPPSWSAVPALAGGDWHRCRQRVNQPCAQRRSARTTTTYAARSRGRRPPTTKWLLHALPVRRCNPASWSSQRPAVGRRPTKQRAQALRRVELEHPAVPLRPSRRPGPAAAPPDPPALACRPAQPSKLSRSLTRLASPPPVACPLHAGAAAQRRYAPAATPKASSGGPRNPPDGKTDSS